MVQSAEEKKIIALAAEFNEVKSAFVLSKSPLEKLKTGSSQNQTGKEKEQKEKNKKPM